MLFFVVAPITVIPSKHWLDWGDRKPEAYDYKSPTSVDDSAWEHESHYVEHPWIPQKRTLSLAALQGLRQPETVRILDYGCGDDKMVQFFHEEGYQVEGTDISEVVIEKNIKDYADQSFSVTTLDNPAPFPDQSFDVIFSSEVIEHVYGVNFVFSEFNRMLRPGGKLLLTTPYHGLIKNLVIALFYFDSHYSPTWEHIRFFTEKSLGKVCRANGLTPVKWSRVDRMEFCLGHSS